MNNKTDEIEYTKEVLYKRNNSAANKTDELNIQKSGWDSAAKQSMKQYTKKLIYKRRRKKSTYTRS